VPDKASILLNIPCYARAILSELAEADVVHVRCPANISLIAIVLLTVTRRPRLRWVKYAGNWRPQGREAWSYTVQRWWLNRGLQRSLVTVNGQWPGQPAHVRSFLNPCLTDDELAEARQFTAQRRLDQPVRLLFVGQLNQYKGVGRALHILAALHRRHIDATLDLVGDGDERAVFEALASELNVQDRVTFHGWLPRTAISAHYAAAHILLFPTKSSEGWPKVLSEAMAYGVVPISGDVSSIPQYLQTFETGRALPPDQIERFVDAILWYIDHPEQWQREAENAARAAPLFGYSSYLVAVRELLGLGT
jgi:glycosyltransferase involved in cell wall biosynthesis